MTDGIIVAANQAMARHPGIDKVRDIKSSHSSRDEVVAWLSDGVPVPRIRDTTERAVASFRPAGRDRQISSMRYFDDTVREARDRKRAVSPPGKRGSVRDLVDRLSAIADLTRAAERFQRDARRAIKRLGGELVKDGQATKAQLAELLRGGEG